MTNVTIAISPDWTIDLDIPGITVLEWDFKTPPPAEHIDIAVAPHVTTADLVERVAETGTKLLQLGSIGYDSIPRDLPDGLEVANAATVHETATAEHALAMLLYAARDIDRVAAQQREGRWESFDTLGLADTKIILIGIGGVGTAIAQRLAPFETNVVRVARRAREDIYGKVYSLSDLPELLPDADSVIVVVPLNESTENLVDDEFLSAMKDGAILVNIARGKVADTDALLKHADRLRITLDVTDPEPLPDGHPLFEKATLITPHIGGNTSAMYSRMNRLVRRQVGNYISGEPFVNVVLGTSG
ncbi:NAD(P)-dependent oxidoreductase [Flaviflexus huanghaiensis]|uniref:NAD(P)-dependent oxidoreductase n=1 Tax=Flaviflexus huanghaiensis TaxID=1111473 RepID=UPI0015FD6AEB